MVLRTISDRAPFLGQCHGMYLGSPRIADGTYRRRPECEQGRQFSHIMRPPRWRALHLEVERQGRRQSQCRSGKRLRNEIADATC
jgi:hypothetical protein